MSRPRRQSGFSLVEIMVAMVISLVLMGGVIQIYLANSQTNRLTQASARVQENGRFAVQILSQTLRNTGYAGCMQSGQLRTVSQVAVTSAPPNYVPTPGNSLQGWDNVSSSTTINGSSVSTVAGTDAVALRGAAGSSVPLTAANNNLNNGQTQVVADPNNWSNGDLLFVSDCESGDYLRLSQDPNPDSGNPGVALIHGNASGTLSRIYGAGAQVVQFQQVAYFIRDTGRNASNDGRDILALYRRIDGGNPQEIISGVEDMQLVYGEDTNNDGEIDRYANWGAVNPQRVLAVRAQLWVASNENNVLDDARTYTIAGNAVTDRRLRQQFTTTTVLRNRAL